MRLLLGSFTHNIDTKGRINVPSSFRKQLEEVVVLTIPYTQDAILIISQEEYIKRQRKFAQLPTTNKNIQKFMREIDFYTSLVGIDSHGRILIPEILREKFGLKNGEEVLILGRGENIEIWNPKQYEASFEEDDYDADEVLRELSKLGM